MNLYGFVTNNPLMNYDYLGLCCDYCIDELADLEDANADVFEGGGLLGGFNLAFAGNYKAALIAHQVLNWSVLQQVVAIPRTVVMAKGVWSGDLVRLSAELLANAKYSTSLTKITILEFEALVSSVTSANDDFKAMNKMEAILSDRLIVQSDAYGALEDCRKSKEVCHDVELLLGAQFNIAISESLRSMNQAYKYINQSSFLIRSGRNQGYGF